MRRLLVLVFLFFNACGEEQSGDPPCSGSECIEADAGVSAVDSGSVRGDAGPSSNDTGFEATDAGQPPEDAGGTPPNGADICAIHAAGYLSGCSNGYCHGRPAAASPSGGLQLDHSSPQALRESLINGEGNSRLFTVVPNNPAMSYLLNKLRGTQDQVVNGGGGDQMPPGGGYLEAVQIDQIEAWIVAGATADCP